jgi:CheY-like chemotaxis protein
MNRGRILIADSNKSDRQRLSKVLLVEGYEVLEATDGAEAVSTIHSHRPDLVLLNTTFPPDVAHGGGAFTDGFLIIDWLKRMEEAQAIRIVLITSEDAAQLHDKARASGAMGLFQKPINPEPLLHVLQQILGGVPSQAG